MSVRIPQRDTEIRFVTKFGGNRPLRSCWKVVWFTTHKKTRVQRDLSQPPFCPKWTDHAQNYLDMSTYTEFGPDRLDFAGLIPVRLIFRPKKSLQYRLSAYNLGYHVKNTLTGRAILKEGHISCRHGPYFLVGLDGNFALQASVLWLWPSIRFLTAIEKCGIHGYASV